MKINQILNRFYVHDIEQSIKFYERILNEKCNLQFKYSKANLELAQVGNILIISGSDQALKPFRDTKATFLVDSIIEFKDFLLNNGATIIRDLKSVPTGMNMTVKHLDGSIVEYVEYKNNF
ncbi:VOC family protein [Clostridium estertheticum]|uniref:VOC family protein n=1 Tax=Clostridium estertheticum TaxID=238834 RepID=UPI001CF2B5CB|nr:VOC family protein [Clostridium estertheticum]MCB2355529.1 VOC family protein [Clostridium estertheticum]WAG43012.1 VOC family protein [Clostridium estertheticum]